MTDENIYFPDIIGNGSLTRRLSKDISENRLSHAYIIEGIKGVKLAYPSKTDTTFTYAEKELCVTFQKDKNAAFFEIDF